MAAISHMIAAILSGYGRYVTIMSQQARKNQHNPIAPIDPMKRASAIRGAIAKKCIKPSKTIDETLALLDEIVAQETKIA